MKRLFLMIVISNLSYNFYCLIFVVVNTSIYLFNWLNYIHPLLRISLMEKLMTSDAEKYNGWAAMLGLIAALGAYSITGQIIPGIF